MCHIHHDPDAIIQAYTDELVERVINEVMSVHREGRMPAVVRVTEIGLGFQQFIAEHIHHKSAAAKRIEQEMNSLGFVEVYFANQEVDGHSTSMEYTLTTLDKFEEMTNV
jgi:hypothetical protein